MRWVKRIGMAALGPRTDLLEYVLQKYVHLKDYKNIFLVRLTYDLAQDLRTMQRSTETHVSATDSQYRYIFT